MPISAPAAGTGERNRIPRRGRRSRLEQQVPLIRLPTAFLRRSRAPPARSTRPRCPRTGRSLTGTAPYIARDTPNGRSIGNRSSSFPPAASCRRGAATSHGLVGVVTHSFSGSTEWYPRTNAGLSRYTGERRGSSPPAPYRRREGRARRSCRTRSASCTGGNRRERRQSRSSRTPARVPGDSAHLESDRAVRNSRGPTPNVTAVVPRLSGGANACVVVRPKYCAAPAIRARESDSRSRPVPHDDADGHRAHRPHHH
jgi:hypothetical protein